MRYSVYDPATHGFSYWDTPQVEERANAPAPTHLQPRTLGSTVEQACWPLPAGAVKVGQGPSAQGRIAILPSMALGTDADGSMPWVKAGLLMAAGALGVKFLLPKRRIRR